MEDRSALFNQLKEFSQRKLKKVETKVVTGLGENLVEKRGAKGLQVLKDGGGNDQAADAGQEPPRKLDLQVGFVLPGLLMGSQDVAHDKSSLESYGIEYILNLDAGVENKFEDEYNYKNVPMKDTSEFKLESVLDDCFDFIDDGRHRSNVFVHCSGTIGLSRCTTICVAYLMNKEKLSFNDAFNQVKEARSFVRPNEGFLNQLKEYEVKLRGAQQVKDSGIDDPFALRKKQEIEQEKAMVAGAASVKNRMKMFGATLDSTADASSRSKSVSPMPTSRQQPESSPPKPQSKWSASSSSTKPAPATPTSTKSMTPEPRSWTSKTTTAGAPPPPPPMPAVPLHANNNTSKSFPPPPPPPPPTGSLLENNNNKSSSSNQSRLSSSKANPTTSKPTTTTTTTTSSSDDTKQPLVFGRRPPPPMKLRGGISMERSDSMSSNDSKQPTTTTKTHSTTQRPQVLERCASPLVLTNNVTPSPTLSSDPAEPRANPFEYWQRTLKERADQQQPMTQQQQQLPKRTVSLGPRRQVSAGLQLNPFLRSGGGGGNESKTPAPAPRPPLIRRPSNESFDRAAHDLQSSLTELDQLIKSGETQTLRQRSSTFTQQQQQQQQQPPARRLEPKPLMIPLSAQPGHLSASGFISRTGCEPEDDDNGPSVPRWQWQDDLTNWKMSSSVNDLRSMFDQPKISSQSARLPPASRPPVGMSTRMRRLTSGSNDTKGSLQLPLKKQFTSDSDGESGGGGGRAENPRAPSPSAALRAAKQQATSSQNKTSDEHSKLPPTSGGGLNRSSTKKLLNLIKTKTRTDLTLPDGDENDEIEALLGALESESIDNIDWDELGLDEDEVKDIIKRGGELSESGESESSEEEEDEEEEEEEEEEVETSTMHYVIRTK